jgi:hypothetical protein
MSRVSVFQTLRLIDLLSFSPIGFSETTISERVGLALFLSSPRHTVCAVPLGHRLARQYYLLPLVSLLLSCGAQLESILLCVLG